MRAVLCHQYGPPSGLVEQEVPQPVPGADEVLIRVAATGLGFATGLMIQGLYQIKPPLPFCPDGEFAGVVEAVGAGVNQFKPGDRVFGTGNAALADYMLATSDACYATPEGIKDAVAASLYGNYLTALHAFRDRGALQPGETVLVLGASGGVGTAAIAVAKSMGAKRVIGGASSEEKRAVALACGANAVVDYTQPDWRQALKALCPDGLDVVYDPVGGDLSETAFRSISEGGRFLVIGFAAGAIPSIGLNLPLLKTASIVGVNWGGLSMAHPERNRELMLTVLDWLRDGKLVPVAVSERPAGEFVRAFEDQLAGKVTGKLVLVR
jgi:NADPH2:quinone reductase